MLPSELKQSFQALIGAEVPEILDGKRESICSHTCTSFLLKVYLV